jgi:hypothetical protein
VRKTERAFGARSARSLIIAKFVPGLNTAAPPLAGVLRMPVGQFIGYSAAGAVVWSTAWVGVGFIFSEQLELAASYEARLGDGLGVLVVAAAAGYIAWKYIARQRFLRKIRIARITPEDLKVNRRRWRRRTSAGLRAGSPVAHRRLQDTVDAFLPLLGVDRGRRVRRVRHAEQVEDERQHLAEALVHQEQAVGNLRAGRLGTVAISDLVEGSAQRPHRSSFPRGS